MKQGPGSRSAFANMAAIFALHAKERGERAPEVLLPATVPFDALGAMSDENLVPLLFDVRPGVYVGEAVPVIPALCERTVGLYLPWMYGNAPDLRHIAPACAIHDVLLETGEPHEWSDERAFWRLYDGLSLYADKLRLPERVDGGAPHWTHFPLLARDGEERDRLVAELRGAEAMPACPADDERTVGLGPWGILGSLPGARAMAERGLTLPLDPLLAKRIGELLQ